MTRYEILTSMTKELSHYKLRYGEPKVMECLKRVKELRTVTGIQALITA